jgi:large subunit ribosomal protein L9
LAHAASFADLFSSYRRQPAHKDRTMEVILLERISRVGQMGDTVKVRDGFARNFLLPQGKALRANEANKKKFEGQRAQLESRNNERKADALKIAEALDGKSFVAVRTAGETGQLYGSVSTRDIAELLAAEGFNVSRNQVQLNQPLKAIGLANVVVGLHPEVEVTITLNIARSPEEAERQAAGETLTSAEAIYGQDINERPETYREPEEMDAFEQEGQAEGTAEDEA